MFTLSDVKKTARDLLATNSGYTLSEAVAEAYEYWANFQAAIELGLAETEDREYAEANAHKGFTYCGHSVFDY
jgi:plasmid maintenance system antidote protein VapI